MSTVVGMPPKPRKAAMTAAELRELLQRANVSQRELARRMGIHFTTVNRWCREGGTPVDEANALLIRKKLKKF
jgi:DNA-binding transcriptional regulator YiaG